MAEVLNDFVFAARKRPRQYPWDEWFDGQVWMVTQGEDFDMTLKNFRSFAYDHAKQRGVKIRTRTIAKPDGDQAPYIIMQAFPIDEPADTP